MRFRGEHHVGRRIRPDWWVVDKNSGNRRLSTAAFEDSSDSPMSATHGEGALARGRTQQDFVAPYPRFGLAAINIGFLRVLQPPQGIHAEPTAEDPDHVFVFGEKPRGLRKRICDHAALLIHPTIEI